MMPMLKPWADAFGEFSYEVTFEQVRIVIGMGGIIYQNWCQDS